MKTKTIKLVDIQPAKYNPRKDLKPGDSQYEAIKNSIETFGFVEPLIVNQRNNTLVGGHQRYKILLAQGVEETEAVLVDLDEQDERALNVALNKIDGEWDNVKGATSPARAYGGILQPCGVDEHGDVVYKYAGKK